MTTNSPRDAGGIGYLVLAGGLLLLIGGLLAFGYCESRRAHDFQLTQQLASLGERCVLTLGEIKPAEMVLARQARPQPVPVAIRDSSRERRWTTLP